MFEAFTARFAREEQEVTALIRNTVGAVKAGGFWEVRAAVLGMVLGAAGRADRAESWLEWPVREEELPVWKKGIGRFCPGQICRLRVRRELEQCARDRAEAGVRWYVTEVLDPRAVCPALERIWESWRTPVVVADRRLGRLTLSRMCSVLGGDLVWNGTRTTLLLEVEAGRRASWRRARAAARRMERDQARWDRDMRAFAARQLTALANRWQAGDGAEITEEAFARRIHLAELKLTPAGDFAACYQDDGMFWGYRVEVRGSLRGGLVSAEIAG